MSESKTGHEPKAGPKTAKDLYPYPEDWEGLQGGRPRVFRQKANPNAPWKVVHVYEEHPDFQRRFQSGVVVDTQPPGPDSMSGKIVWREVEGKMSSHEFMIPSFMDRNVHGGACEIRTDLQGGETYARIRTQRQYEDYLDNLIVMGYEEVRFGVTDDGYVFRALPEIRPSRPLSSQPTE